jgi:plasmid stabilization system protein ParE
MMRVLAEAEAELEDARHYLSQQVRGLGERFIDDVELAFLSIAQHPLIFPKLEILPDSAPYRRALLRTFRYAIIFEIVEDTIVVVAVAHSSRKPYYWLGRKFGGA